MSPIDGSHEGGTAEQRICRDCLVAKSIGDFPSRGAGKLRTRCILCFRAYTNAKRRKPEAKLRIENLAVVLYAVTSEHESWVDVLVQILFEKCFLTIEKIELEEECIDLKVLLKAEDRIANLVHMEMENEKSSHLPPGINGRAS